MSRTVPTTGYHRLPQPTAAYRTGRRSLEALFLVEFGLIWFNWVELSHGIGIEIRAEFPGPEKTLNAEAAEIQRAARKRQFWMAIMIMIRVKITIGEG